ncbi:MULTISPECIES: LysR family transcriptional regulator [Variovorax]|uniref:LysR family transcriptional regulator n=1 Tax=Variovorax atrisoli TaxID=3394203 RepID=UPI00119A516B|nr:LysR family transcriptional regulator [Variovorax paradoxus]MDR6517927.1 DNA-binding transcriptional LysR family regulator [Variovorax paradoxus]
MNLSVADLTAFIEIVRSGSISRAAQHLGVTQPSVSKAIRRLEDEVGVQLLERGLHGARLTAEGEMFLEAARRFELQRFDLTRAASELRARHAGLLRLGITSPAADSVAVMAAAEMVRKRPGMRLRLRIGKSDALDAAVEDGEIDLAVVPSYTGQSLLSTQLQLGEDHIRVVVRQGHPLTKKPVVGLNDLTPYAWVMAPPQSAARRHFFAIFERNGVPLPSVAVETEYTSEAAMGILSSTDLLSIVPDSVLRSWLGKAVPLNIPELVVNRTLVLLSRPGARWSPLMTDFRELVSSYRPKGHSPDE